jgi:lipoprotein-anchoring transpeptidase ErfK/SrfK
MLDGMYASAAGPADYARVGALAHLEADALQFDLIRTLPARALVISTEDQNVTYYRNGKAVYSSPVATDAETPVGVFHIQAKQRSLPTIYWTNIGRFSRYRYGSLPDWMAFSSQAALQGAPWRSDFGAGSDAVQPAYAPSTPGSVDLPPAAADVLFAEIPLGTEVVIY